METSIKDLEESLRLAMLSSDIKTLDRLVSDSLLFIGPDGTTFRKQDDLELHRSKRQKLDQADWKDIEIEECGDSAVSVVTAFLSGSLDGVGFSGRFKYIRMWARIGETWKIVGGSVTSLGS